MVILTISDVWLSGLRGLFLLSFSSDFLDFFRDFLLFDASVDTLISLWSSFSSGLSYNLNGKSYMYDHVLKFYKVIFNN